MARSTRITIEANSLLIVRCSISSRSWCARCAEETEMIPLDSTDVLSNLLPHELEEWLNSDDLHRLQTPGRSELICLNSLLARLGRRQTK